MRRRRITAALLAAALLGACSSDDSSIVDSGDEATTPAAASTAAASTTPASTGPAGSGGGSQPSTTTGAGSATTAAAASATTATSQADLSAYPACPTEALAAAADPVEITVWHGMAGDVLIGAFEQLVSDYNASQTEVRVDVVGQTTYEDVIDKYLQSDQGSLPDVAQMPEYMVQNIVDSGTAVPMEACIRSADFDTSPFIPSALRAYTTGDVQWSMPFNVSDPVLYYNKKAFIAAGLDPEKPPTSLAEVRAHSEQIVASGASEYGLALESGFDSGGGWYIEQWFAQLGKFYADNENGRAGRATKVLYNDAEGVDLLTQLQSMIDDGLAVDVGDNTATGYDNLLKLADESESAAMTIGTSAFLGSVISILQGGQFPAIAADDVGIGPLPGPGGAEGALVGGASLWITDSGDADKIAASWDFVRYMVGAQQQSTWSATTGYVAVRDDASELDPLKARLSTDPRFAVALEQLLVAPDAPTSAGPILGPLREVRTVTAQAVARILGGADVQQSLDEAAQEANSLIADYNSRNG